MKKFVKDDKGFTLIELLIAIAIIAIVMIPLFRNFRQSTYLNGKAKLAMDANNMATNVMEGLSAYSAEDIILSFYTSADKAYETSSSQNTLNILPNEVTCGDYGDVLVSGTSKTINFSIENDISGDSEQGYAYPSKMLYAKTLADGTVSTLSADYLEVIESKTSGSRMYYFYAKDVTQARGTYDVLLELEVLESEYNDYAEASLTSINGLYDGIYSDSTTDQSEAVNTFISYKKATSTVTAAQILAAMEREMSIDITLDSATGFYYVKVTNTYSIASKYGSSDFSSTSYTATTVTAFDGSTYGQMPRDIYIYYYGNYNSKSGNVLDNIKINNTANVDVDIHLVRVASSDTDVTAEQLYYANVYITEDVSDGYNTQVYSNLRDNLGDTSQNDRDYMYRISYYINGSLMSEDTDEAYAAMVFENGAVKTEVRDRIYKVTMYVYNQGAADAGFPEDDLIITFTGGSSN